MSTPVPDPTLLTMEALHREIGAARELLEEKIANLDTKMTGHFLIDDQRFRKHDEALQAADRLRLEEKENTSRQVSAALQSQKDLASLQEISNQKAIDKTEKATEARLVDLAASNRASVSAIHGKIDDLKDRVARWENRKEGVTEAKNETRDAYQSLRGYANVLIAGIALILAYLALHHTATVSTTTDPVTVMVTTTQTVTVQKP